jgi:hypothetical protein
MARQDQFMFGPDLLVAPVIEPDARERRLYLPRGEWVDLWRSLAYRERSGAFEPRRAELLEGGREVTVPAPLEEIPLFARAGTILPLLAGDVDTLAGTTKRGVVDLGERRHRLSLLAFPRGRSSAAFGRHGRLRSVERKDSWRLAIEAPRVTAIDLEASLATLRRRWRPCRVNVDGERLPRSRWSYSKRREVLEARFTAKRAPLTVERC